MKFFRKMIVRMAVLMLLCALPRQAEAQALLGTDVARPLSVTASTFAGYDTDITARGSQGTGGSAVPAGVDTGAANAGASLSMSYSSGARKISYYTMGSSEYRYYHATDTATAGMASGGAGVGVAIGRRARLNALVNGTYFPRFQLSVLPSTTDFPIDEPQPTMDYGISSFDVVSYGGSAILSYQLSSRSSVNVSYGRNQFKYLGRDYGLSSHIVGGGYSRSLTRYATMQLGYSEQVGEYLTDDGQARPTVRRRTIDAGIRYSRPLSISRRTTVGFSTGSTALDNGTQTFYKVIGGANLNHQLSRTWNLGVAYSRRASLVGGFSEPIFSDSTSVNASGLAGRRVSVSLSAGYANGNVGQSSRGRNYNLLRGNAGVSVPITRRMSFFGSYFYYRHMFDGSVSLPLGTTPRASRNGVRAGLSWRIY